MNRDEFISELQTGRKDFSGVEFGSTAMSSLDLRDCIFRDCIFQPFTRFSWSDLGGADFRGCNLVGNHFERASCKRTKFTDAIMAGTNFEDTDLTDAILTGTCLDPQARIPYTGLENWFEIDTFGYFTAYRTYRSMHVGDNQYEPGEIYYAPWFSVDSETDCHPGLYFTTQEKIYEDYCDDTLITVRVHIDDAIATEGEKFRCRQFEVIDYVE